MFYAYLPVVVGVFFTAAFLLKIKLIKIKKIRQQFYSHS